MSNEGNGEALAPADTVAEPGQTATQQPDTATTDAQADPVKDEAESKPDEKRFTQEELDRQIRLRVSREQRKYERRLGELEARVQHAPQPAQPAQPVGRPTLESFKSYDDFQEALIEWKAEQIVSKRDEQRQRGESNAAQQRRMADLSRRFEAAEESARDAIEDYDDVVATMRPGALPLHVVEAIGESDVGPQLLYRLASDRKLAAEVAALSPVAATRRLTKLESELEKPAPKSKAPDPVRPLAGRAADASDAPSDKDDVDTWVRKERARMAKLGIR